MKKQESKENQNKSIGFGISVGFHALVLLLFFLLTAWKDPYPENPGIPGVELNFGTTDAGMGDLSNQTDVISNNYDDASPDKPAASDAPTETQTAETPKTDIKQGKLVTTTADSPYQVNDKADATKTTKDQKATDASSPKNDAKDSNTNGANGKNGDKSQTAASSNGDKNVLGDQGDSRGTIDGRSLYGNPGNGGGGGPSLNMAGWRWDDVPNKVDPSSEKGSVEFEFKVDEYGNVEWSRAIKKTVSPSVVQFYKNQLDATTFTRTGNNIKNYIGTVRFEVKAH